jgi:hypothetical protein
VDVIEVLHILRDAGSLPVAIAPTDKVIDLTDPGCPRLHSPDGPPLRIDAGVLLTYVFSAARVVIW